MNLFIDAVSSNWILIVFDDNRKIYDKMEFNIKWNESSKLIVNIDNFLKKNILEYNDLKNIIVVNWPGSFTGIRTIVLVINSINYITNQNITPISYFDLFSKYPIVKSSSKRDSFFKENASSEIKIIQNEDLFKYFKDKKITSFYWETNSLLFDELKNYKKVDYETIISKIKFKDYKIISPLYIKKPNIS